MARILGKISLLLTVLFLLFGIQSCTIVTESTVLAPQIRTLFKGTYKVDPYMEDHRPVTVAVLPFLDKSGSKAGAIAVRKGFYNHFSSLPFRDMELQKVDDLLRKANLEDAEAIFKIAPQELGKILGVDAVIFGEISNFDKLFAVMYSQVAVGAEIKMYDAKTGKFLWSGQHTEYIREGGLSVSPVGIIAVVIATAMNVRDIQLLRACDDLFREMVKTIPTPTIAEALRPPVITLLTQDTKNLPKKAGDEIKIVIQGAPKMQAYFDIGDFKKRIDMQELDAGWYLGTYKVLPGDNTTRAMVTGYLRDDSGNTSQWVDAIGSVTIDTTPPEKIKVVKTLGRNNLVSVSWDKPLAHDLAGYNIYRSLTPLSGFQEIGRGELNEWRDEKALNGQKYYYQLTAIDWAGNESERSETVLGMPVAPGPTPVAGDIEVDTIWYAGASPYILSQRVVIKDKARLTIEPGTEIRSKGGALVIEGQIDARGTKENLIVFTGAEEGKAWEGLIFNNTKEKENSLQYLRISQAAIAINGRASSPRIEDSEITGNVTALKIEGAFSMPSVARNTIHKNSGDAVIIIDGAKPSLVGNTIADNLKTGIFIEAATPTIKKNVIVRNQGTGVAIHKSTAEIRENKIMDNKPLEMEADRAGESVNALDNWWGSVHGIDILARIGGKINISSVLDGETGKSLNLPILVSPLGGVIEKDSFLILSNSPYKLTKDVTVTAGATLYIEPGVAILYEQNRAITVEDGGVIARGRKDMPIVFGASGTAPMPGFYASAVRFTKPTKVNSAFSFCIVKYAETAFDIHYGAPEISHCHIAYNSQSGIFSRNDAGPKITYSSFSNNLGEGAIRSVGMSRPVINYNNFNDNAFAIQAFSSIYLDARYNWWGNSPPDDKYIFTHGDNSVNIAPWLEKPEEKAFKE